MPPQKKAIVVNSPKEASWDFNQLFSSPTAFITVPFWTIISLRYSILAIIIALLSVILYFASTDGAPWYVTFCGVSINFLQNYLGAYKAVPSIVNASSQTAHHITDCGENKKNLAPLIGPNFLSRPSLPLAISQLGISLPWSFVSTLPFAVATFLSQQHRGFPVALTLAGLNYIGSIPLFLYALMQVVEGASHGVKRKILSLYRYFRPDLATTPEQIENLRIISERFANQLNRLLDAIYRGELSKKEYPFDDGSIVAQLEAIAAMLQQLERQKSIEPGKLRRLLNTSGSILSKSLFIYPTAAIVGLTSVGYSCSVAAFCSFLSFALIQFPVGNFCMLALYYLGFEGARGVTQQFVSWIKDLLHGDFAKAKPDIIRYLGPILGPFLILVIMACASFSGYSAEKFYQTDCVENIFPKLFDELDLTFLKPYLLDGSIFNAIARATTNYGTVIFNAIYGYITVLLLARQYKQAHGSDEERFDITLREILENAIKNIGLFSLEKQKELANLLSQLHPDQRQVLLGTTAAVGAANSLIQFGIHRSTSTEKRSLTAGTPQGTYDTFSPIPAASSTV